MLEDVSRAQIVKWVGYYMVIVGILRVLCGPLMALVGGIAAAGGLAGALSSPFAREASGEIAQASGELVAASGLLLVLGIVGFIAGIAMLIVGVGLLQRRSWSRMGTVVIAGVNAVISLLLFLSGSGGLEIVWLAIGAFVAYLFYTDAGIKQELGENSVL